MPQADTPRKHGHHWLLLPWVVVIVAAIAWSFWWFHGRQELKQTLDTLPSQLRSQGLTIGWAGRKIYGFPFRYDVSFSGFSASQANGLSVSADTLDLEANAYDPTHWVGVVTGPLHVVSPKVDMTVSGQVLRFSVSHPRDVVPHLSLEGVHLTLTGSGPFSAIDRFEARLAAKPDNTASFFLRIDKATASPTSLLARLAQPQGIIVGLEGDLTQPAALKASQPLAKWAAAGGVFNVRQGGIQAGQALLSLRPSSLYPTPDGFVNGELALSLTKPSDSVLALGAVGGIPSETAAVGSGVASVGQAFGLGKSKPFNVTFKFHDGGTTVGGVPIGPAPRLFRP